MPQQKSQRTNGPPLQPPLPSANHGLALFHGVWPLGPPDMALFLFTKAILEGRPIEVFNFGAMQRDFAYVDDIVEAIERVLGQAATPRDPLGEGVCATHDDRATSLAPYRVFNVGNQHPASLLDLSPALNVPGARSR